MKETVLIDSAGLAMELALLATDLILPTALAVKHLSSWMWMALVRPVVKSPLISLIVLTGCVNSVQRPAKPAILLTASLALILM